MVAPRAFVVVHRGADHGGRYLTAHLDLDVVAENEDLLDCVGVVVVVVILAVVVDVVEAVRGDVVVDVAVAGALSCGAVCRCEHAPGRRSPHSTQSYIII